MASEQQGQARSVREPGGLFLVAFAGATYGLYELVQALPPHSKTLAREAVIAGFVGALLVVRELAAPILRELPGLVVPFLPGVALVASFVTLVIGGLTAIHVSLPGWLLGFIFPLVLVFAFALIDPVDERLKRVKLPDSALIKWTARYGPASVGAALLVLSMFLQLRSIDLSKG
jgi:hypothetical protein